MVCWVPSAANNIPTAWQLSYFCTSVVSALASFPPMNLGFLSHPVSGEAP